MGSDVGPVAPTTASGSGTNGLVFGLLGPLQASRGGATLPLGGRQQRAVLALLLAEAGSTVSLDRLADALWGESVSAGYTATLQTYVFHLREVLEPGRGRGAPGRLLLTRPGGYALHTSDATVDATEFERLAKAGHEALAHGDHVRASALLGQALGLWRGEVLADLAGYDFVTPIAARLDELRLTALEDRIDADLALGRHASLVAELDQLVDRHPLRERLSGQRMLALYRCGRQSDALAAYRELHNTLDDELGIQPSASLRELHRAILSQDASLDWRPPDASLGEAPIAAVSAPAMRRRPRARFLVGAACVVLAAAGAIIAVVATHRPRHSLAALPANSVGAIHADGSLHDAVPVGQSPGAIAYGAGSLWVANTGYNPVSRIDPRSQDVVQTIPVGPEPAAITVTGRDVWVVNYGDGTVSRINADVDRVVQGPIRVGSFPDAIASGPSGVWVASSGDDTIVRIDPDTGAVGKAIPVGDGPDGLAVDAHAVWVTDARDATVSRVDPKTGDVAAPIHVGAGAAGIAVTPDAVWVANSAELSVARIDPAAGTITGYIRVGDGPTSIAAAGRYVWVADEYDGTVTRIDPRHGNTTRRFATGASPVALVAAGSAVWVTSRAFAGTAHRGGTLTIAEPDLPGHDNGIDPANNYGPTTVPPERFIYDGLVAFRRAEGPAGYVLVPDLATHLPQPDTTGTTYTFTIRSGIQYSTGAAVRASDFARGLQRAIALSTQGGNPTFFADVIGGQNCIVHPRSCDLSRGAQADNAAGTLTIRLTKPDPEFLYKLAWFVYPAPAGTPTAAPVTSPLPGTGPYMIADYNRHTGTYDRVVRNPHFHQWSFAAQPDGYPNVIRWLYEKSSRAGVDAVLAGRADATAIPYWNESAEAVRGLVDDLARSFPTRLHTQVEPETDYVNLNTRVAPFNNVLVRRALNYAVDRRKLVELSGGSALADPTCQLVPPNFPGHQSYCPYTRNAQDGSYGGADLDTARRLVAESGTSGMHITVHGFPEPAFHAISAYIVSVLRQLGYRVSLHEIPDPQAWLFLSDSRNQVQVADSSGWAADYPSAANFYFSLFSCASFVPNNGRANANWSEVLQPQPRPKRRHSPRRRTHQPGAGSPRMDRRRPRAHPRRAARRDRQQEIRHVRLRPGPQLPEQLFRSDLGPVAGPVTATARRHRTRPAASQAPFAPETSADTARSTPQ
jgi:YVTN family beta-propeller protein